jgi:hypothetical protein
MVVVGLCCRRALVAPPTRAFSGDLWARAAWRDGAAFSFGGRLKEPTVVKIVLFCGGGTGGSRMRTAGDNLAPKPSAEDRTGG